MTDKPAARGLAGLRAQVARGPRADGRWYWRIVREERGTRTRFGSGWWTESEVDLELAAIVHTGRGGKLPAPVVDGSGCRTVRDLCELYVGDVERLVVAGQRAPHTLRELVRCQNRWERRGSMLLSAVTTSTLREHALGRLADGCATSTAVAEVGFLRAAWRWALEEALVTLPVPKPPELHVEPFERAHVPSPDEVAAVLRWLRAHPGKGQAKVPAQRAMQRAADLLEVQELYGCRIEEVAHLRARDVGADVVRFTGCSGGKTGARILPLVDAARPILSARAAELEPEAWLWGAVPATVMRYAWLHLGEAIEALVQPAVDATRPPCPLDGRRRRRRGHGDAGRSVARELAGDHLEALPPGAWSGAAEGVGPAWVDEQRATVEAAIRSHFRSQRVRRACYRRRWWYLLTKYELLP